MVARLKQVVSWDSGVILILRLPGKSVYAVFMEMIKLAAAMVEGLKSRKAESLRLKLVRYLEVWITSYAHLYSS